MSLDPIEVRIDKSGEGDSVLDRPALEARIAELEAEVARLLPIEAAAREAVAFWQGRRPGFAASYPQELLRSALGAPAKRRSPRRRDSQ